jgi:SEC-C motif
MDPAAREKIERRLNALIAADFAKLHADLTASSELCNALKTDFLDALDRVIADQNSGVARRGVVRCFGSLIDGVTASMRFAAIGLCESFGEPLNPFLQEKTGERHISTHQRIYSIYRLLADFLPGSPLSHVPDARWDELRRALEIRNRVVHPTAITDLELTVDEMKVVLQAGHDFYRDYAQFPQWFGQKEQKLFFELPGARKRWLKKIGRNEPCPCGSKRKYKNCCGVGIA